MPDSGVPGFKASQTAKNYFNQNPLCEQKKLRFFDVYELLIYFTYSCILRDTFHWKFVRIFVWKFFKVSVSLFFLRIGGESLAVAQNNYAVLWFKGKELNLVFGFQMSFARVGSFVNFQVVEPLYHYVNKYYKGYECLGIVLFIGKLISILF